MTANQLEAVKQFFLEESTKAQNTGSDFGKFLVDLFIKTKAEQKAIMVQWLDKKKTINTAAIASLEAQKISTNDRLTQENMLIDSVKAVL